MTSTRSKEIEGNKNNDHNSGLNFHRLCLSSLPIMSCRRVMGFHQFGNSNQRSRSITKKKIAITEKMAKVPERIYRAALILVDLLVALPPHHALLALFAGEDAFAGDGHFLEGDAADRDLEVLFDLRLNLG